MDTPPPKPEDESLLDLEMQAPAPPPVPASEEGRLPQSFAEMHIAVVVVDEGLGAALRQAFELRGGKVEVFEDGADLFDEERGEEHFQIVLVCDDVIYNGINYLTRELRLEAWPKVDVLWFFGKQAVEEVDGWTKRPCRTVTLLKAIYRQYRLTMQGGQPSRRGGGKQTTYESKPDFSGRRIALVTTLNDLSSTLAASLHKYGGIVEPFDSGKAMLARAKTDPFSIIVVTEDVMFFGIKDIAKAVRGTRETTADLVWYIGKVPVKQIDGFTKYPLQGGESLIGPLWRKLQKVCNIEEIESEVALQVQTKGQVLVVEDDADIRGMVVDALRDAGWQVIEAGNGEQALEQFDRHPNLNLIITDLNMPVMNGFRFLKELRSRGAGGHVPKVVITGHTEKKTIEIGKRLQVKAWITKPFNSEKVVETVAKLIEKKAS